MFLAQMGEVEGQVDQASVIRARVRRRLVHVETLILVRVVSQKVRSAVRALRWREEEEALTRYAQEVRVLHAPMVRLARGGCPQQAAAAAAVLIASEALAREIQVQVRGA